MAEGAKNIFTKRVYIVARPEYVYTMTKPNPIAIRPRQGTALEAVWEAEGRSNKAMGDIIHSWAETFAIMAKASGQDDDQ